MGHLLKAALDVPISRTADYWWVAASLSDAGCPVIRDSLDNLPRRFEILHATLENSARHHAAGVRFAFGTGSTHNVRNLTHAAKTAVASGLAPDAALAALTREPAVIFGIAEDHGSLEEGKVADLVLWDGDPLEVTSNPDRVYIAVREFPRESRQTGLRDRYLQSGEWPEAYPDSGE